MLNVYAVAWCPHCKKAVEFFKENRIPFHYINLEAQPEPVVKKIIEINGGEDWVVPTLEFNGRWREGKAFDPEELRIDLQKMGVIDQ